MEENTAADGVQKEAGSDWVRIRSVDGFTFVLPRHVACASQFLRMALSQDSGFAEAAQGLVELSNVPCVLYVGAF